MSYLEEKLRIIRGFSNKTNAYDQILQWAQIEDIDCYELGKLIEAIGTRLSIEEIFERGYLLRVGPHTGQGLVGYYASFVKGDFLQTMSWGETGHGLSVEEAIESAVTVFNGANPLPSEDFNP